jgi:hypothetical protein
VIERSAPPSTGHAASEAARVKVLVLFEAGSAGTAAVDLARELAEHDHAAVTIVAAVPQAPSGSRCGNSATEYNEIVRDTVAKELDEARRRLGAAGDGAAFDLLIEGTDPPLAEFVATAGYDVVLLPSRRRPLRSAKHPAAAALRRRTRAEVRIVDGTRARPPRAPSATP